MAKGKVEDLQMLKAKLRHSRYVACFYQLDTTRANLARIFNLGEHATGSSISRINDRLKGTKGKGVTKSELLSIQLLLALQSLGVSLEDIDFDEGGCLQDLQVKTGRSKD